MQQACFGAGCFWGTERYFKKAFADKGAQAFRVGYMGGHVKNPTYKQVCNGDTGHAEVLHFQYDPTKVSFEALVTYFFRMHNPTTLNRQGNDRGTQYRSAVFWYSDEQKKATEAVIAKLNGGESSWQAKLRKAHGDSAEVATTVEKAAEFWPGEDYHQAYLDENPGGYCNHRVYIPDDFQ